MVRHALVETAAAYASDRRVPHRKLSVSLPTELVEELRAAAAETGTGVSSLVASAIRHSLVVAEQVRLERALALDAEDNEAWARDALAMTARAWADLEW